MCVCVHWNFRRLNRGVLKFWIAADLFREELPNGTKQEGTLTSYPFLSARWNLLAAVKQNWCYLPRDKEFLSYKARLQSWSPTPNSPHHVIPVITPSLCSDHLWSTKGLCQRDGKCHSRSNSWSHKGHQAAATQEAPSCRANSPQAVRHMNRSRRSAMSGLQRRHVGAHRFNIRSDCSHWLRWQT